MGEIEIAGRDALKAVQHITSNDASRLAIGQAHYSALPTPQGTFVDDVLTYKLTDEHFMLVVNASNIIKDFNWITTQIAGIGDAVAVNTSSRYALIALQGPAAREVLQALTGVNLADIKYYWFTTGEIAGVRATDLAHRLHRRGRLRSVRAAGVGRARLGRDPPGGQGRPASCRRASARATRCASRRPCGSTATISTRRRPCSKRISAGRSAGRRTSSSATKCCAARSRRA